MEATLVTHVESPSIPEPTALDPCLNGKQRRGGCGVVQCPSTCEPSRPESAECRQSKFATRSPLIPRRCPNFNFQGFCLGRPKMQLLPLPPGPAGEFEPARAVRSRIPLHFRSCNEARAGSAGADMWSSELTLGAYTHYVFNGWVGE